MGFRHIAMLVVCALVVAGTPRPAAAQAVSVIVDGTPIAFDQPPVVTGGRVLIPLRGVFERLGASVEWDPGARLVTARRAATIILLQPGNATARVDGRAVRLDVPAMIVGGRTLVPLRFVGEALGAQVDWDGSRRIVYVASSIAAAPPGSPPVIVVPQPQPTSPPPVIVVPLPQPAPPPPVIVAPEPPRAVPLQFEGTAVRVEPGGAVPYLLVRSDRAIHRVHVTSLTSIFLTEVSSGRGGAASLEQIRPGDHVQIRTDARGQASMIRASYREVAGRFDRFSGRFFHTRDGRSHALADEIRVLLDDREVARGSLPGGVDVVLRVNPVTGEVWEIRARSGGAPPAPPVVVAPVRIEGVRLSTAGPLGVGDTLTVTMDGTPGGRAWFDVERVESGIPMTEEPAGRYTGRRPIQEGEAALRAPVVVHLRVGGREVSRAADSVTVDGVPPEFTSRTPEPNSTVRDPRPEITIGFADRGPAGIDQDSLKVWVNGDPTRMTGVSRSSATFAVRERLSPGRIRVQARIADLAGNEATANWTFALEAAPAPAPTSPPTPQPTSPPTRRPTPPPATPAPTAPPITPAPTATPGPRPTTPSITPAPTSNVRLAPPVITAPGTGSPIRFPFAVEGTAPAGAEVEVTITFQPVSADVSGITLPAFTATARRNGKWEVKVNLAPPQTPGRFTITAVVIAPSGARSEPAQVVLPWTPPR